MNSLCVHFRESFVYQENEQTVLVFIRRDSFTIILKLLKESMLRTSVVIEKRTAWMCECKVYERGVDKLSLTVAGGHYFYSLTLLLLLNGVSTASYKVL